MFTLMIVEDEDIMRRGLVDAVDWNGLGFHVVAEAANGREAFEIFKRIKPDVVLTDIKMTHVDGLELLKGIKSIDRSTEVVLISSYDDFDFARKGLQLGAFSYVLKLELVHEIEKVFKKLKSLLEANKAKQDELDQLTNHRRKEQLLGVLKKAHTVDQSLIPEGCYSVMVAIVDRNPVDNHSMLSKKIAEMDVLWTTEGNTIFFLFHSDRDIDALKGSVRIKAVRIEEMLKTAGFSDYSIGIGGIVCTRDEISDSYREAAKAVDLARMIGEKRACHFEEEKKSLQEFNRSRLDLNMIREMVIRGNDENVLNVIDHDIRGFVESQNAFASSVRSYCIRAAAYAMELVKEKDGGTFAEAGRAICRLNESDSIIDMGDILKAILSDICRKACNTAHRHDNETIQTALEFADKNFNAGITMEETAEYVHMSPPYFSRKFKNETGINFKAYIKRKRMEKSCALLTHTGLRIADIAREVGYDDEKYFCRVFKKENGVSPSAYRKKNKACVSQV